MKITNIAVFIGVDNGTEARELLMNKEEASTLVSLLLNGYVVDGSIRLREEPSDVFMFIRRENDTN